jgi:hypothetical protein
MFQCFAFYDSTFLVGRRLATEREWEFAARGGRINETYPWGIFTLFLVIIFNVE